MKRLLIILGIALSLLIPSSPAIAATSQQERQLREYLVITAIRYSYLKTIQADASQVFEIAYNRPENRRRIHADDYVGTSKRRITTKTLESYWSPKLRTWHVFAINAKRTISKAEFKATTKVLPKCKTEDSTRCYWDASKRGNRKGKSFIAYTRYTVSYVK